MARWRRPRRLVALCALALGVAGLAACGSADDEGTTDASATQVTTAIGPPTAPPDPPPPPVRGPFEAGGLNRIANQLRAQLGRPPRLLEIVLSEHFAEFQVQDPDRPDTVNQYEWRDGVIEGPTPVRVSLGRGSLAERLFPLDSIALNAAARLARAARAQPIEGAEAGTMIIRRGLPFRSDVIWFVNVNGTRDNRQLRALADGRVYEVL